MYRIFSCVPHFALGKIGPELPRQTGYNSNYESAMRQAKDDQGFVRSVND
jgi:hypothetical protein